jgi:hypothetical protein
VAERAPGWAALGLLADGLAEARRLVSLRAEARVADARPYLWIESELTEPAVTRWLTLCRREPPGCWLELPLAGDGFTVEVEVAADSVTVRPEGPRAGELARYAGRFAGP